MKIKETFKEAFGYRFFGFAMISLFPSIYLVAQGWNYFGLHMLIPAIVWNIIWLLVIRFTL